MPILFIAIFIVLILLTNSVHSQTIDPDYAKLLSKLYKKSIKIIQPEELNKILNGKNIFLLDTRTKEEYKISHLKNAIFVDYKSFNIENVSNIPLNSEVVVYCSVGYRSGKIAEILQKNGYQNVLNLYGGIFEWVNEGYDIYNDNGITKKIHGYTKKWSKWLKHGEIIL